ncbi:MAG: ATP-binding protein [Polaromonas sp.]
MPSPSQPKYSLRHTLAFFLVAVLAVFWSAVAWNHRHAETLELDNMRRETAALALLFANQATSTFQGVDHVLRNLRKSWVSQPADMQHEVQDDSGFLGRSILQVAIIDASGFVAYSSLGMPKAPTFLGDREHFRVHQGGLQDKLFVSRPVKGRVSGKWSIQLSRPIFNKKQFAGVIVMSVDPEYFVNFYAQAGLGKDGAASMVRDTGEVMVRSSKQDQYVGTVIKPSPYADPGAPRQGNFRRLSQTDGIDRLSSYVRLPEYGVSVIIGPSVEERLVPVRLQQRQIMLAASVATLLVLFMGWQLLRSLARKEAAQEALAQSKVRLKASHELLEKLSTHVPGMIFQYRLFADGHSTFPYVSDGIERVCEVTPAQAREDSGLVWTRVYPDDSDVLKASIANSARTLQSWSHEFRVSLPQRGLCWMLGHAQPEALDDGSVLWHGSIIDITELKDIEAALSKATKAELRVANHELDAFSYSVSHELRSPLNTIDGFSLLLAKSLTGSDDAKALHYLARIRAGTTQMGRLIADLLALAQVVRAPMQHESVNLSALAGSIGEDLQARQPGRQVALHIEPGLQAQGDAGLLRVVLGNLLGNAWKYSEKQAKAQIRVGQQPDAAGNPVFFVQDNGAGFDMAYAGKLFKPFERLHAVAEFAGTGIGLATAGRVILRHGGRVWAESAPGLGATFFFTLPSVLPVAHQLIV